MQFALPNIYQSIIHANLQLRREPSGIDIEITSLTPTELAVITGNIATIAALGMPQKGQNFSPPTDEGFVHYIDGNATFDTYHQMCTQLAEDCDSLAQMGIKLLIKDIYQVHQAFRVNAEKLGSERGSRRLHLRKDTRRGMVLLSLAKAFDIYIPEDPPA